MSEAAAAAAAKKKNKLLSWFKSGSSEESKGRESNNPQPLRPINRANPTPSDSKDSRSFRRRSLNIDGLKTHPHVARGTTAREPVKNENLPSPKSNDPFDFKILFPRTFPYEEPRLSLNKLASDDACRKAEVQSSVATGSRHLKLADAPGAKGKLSVVPKLDTNGDFLYEYELFPYLRRSHPKTIENVAKSSDRGGHPAFASRNIRESEQFYSWSKRPEASRRNRASILPKHQRRLLKPHADVGVSALADDECSLNCSCQPCLQANDPLAHLSKSPRARNSQERLSRRDLKPPKTSSEALVKLENKNNQVERPWYEVDVTSPVKVVNDCPPKLTKKQEDPKQTSFKEDLSAIIEKTVKNTIEEYLSKNIIPRQTSVNELPKDCPPPPLPKRKAPEPIYDNIISRDFIPPEMASISSIESIVENVLHQYGILPRSRCESDSHCTSSSSSYPEESSGQSPHAEAPSLRVFETAGGWGPRKTGSLPALTLVKTKEKGGKSSQSTDDLPLEADYTTCSEDEDVAPTDKTTTSSVVSPLKGKLRVRSTKHKTVDLSGKAKLKVAIYHNSGLTTVHVIRASKLASHNLAVPSPYVKVCLLPFCHEVNWRTRVKENSSSPAFDEKCSFELGEDDHGRRILISAWSRDFATRKSEFLGCISFGVRNVMSQEVRGWYRLLIPPRTFRTPPRQELLWKAGLPTSHHV